MSEGDLSDPPPRATTPHLHRPLSPQQALNREPKCSTHHAATGTRTRQKPQQEATGGRQQGTQGTQQQQQHLLDQARSTTGRTLALNRQGWCTLRPANSAITTPPPPRL